MKKIIGTMLLLAVSCNKTYTDEELINKAKLICSCQQKLWYIQRDDMFNMMHIKCNNGTSFMVEYSIIVNSGCK